MAYRKNRNQEPTRTQDPMKTQDPLRNQDPSRIQEDTEFLEDASNISYLIPIWLLISGFFFSVFYLY